MTTKEKAALYIRVSTHHQIDKDSLPFQRKELINYSKYVLGIDDYEIFEDAGFSGKNTDRPKFQNMMQRIRAGEFTHLLVWKIDRISRNLKDFTEMYEELKENNITFISKNEQFDTSTAMGEAMLKIILVFAELERKLTAERVFSIMLSRAEKGLWNGAPMPLGYQWSNKDKKPIIDEDEANIVRFIYNTYEKLKSTGEVKKQLEIKGYKTKRNGNWTTKTIADILRNPFYIGTYRYNYRESPHGKLKPEEEWIIVEDNHPAIISKSQFNTVNQILDYNYRSHGGNRNSHIHIFSGLIECAKCNRNYISTVDRPRQDGYRPSIYRCYNYVHSKKKYRECNGNISEVKLGPFVMNYIANLTKAHHEMQLYGSKITEKRLEEILLKGSPFNKVAGINQRDLSATYDVLLKNITDILFDKLEDSNNDIENDYELENLKKEKMKFERALQRLEDLYLFSEESMAEKDYLIKKKQFDDKINEINKKIKQRVKEYNVTLPGQDISFINKASRYLMNNKLLSYKKIDYNEFVKVVDKNVLRDFMKNVIRKISVDENKNITSIEFANGLKHRFIYKI